ncbi:MAG: selenocysteine-specific translation elongation factor [Calditrichaceae bacterium]|nr:selenocysteine-specific translation elongation factor [Calditrichaceae bacterium]
MNNHIIIGMAGHIDHGKTALIKALTGIETDQHKEERERGITIDIGFAYWKDNITIIDVPGHEKFIRNMAAGVNALDLFLLVIAADDGIMPQTIEHMEILKFFGAKDGIVALNKIDLVDEEWQLLVQDEIQSFLKNHGFKNIPVVPVSAIKNKGIDNLEKTVFEKITGINKQVKDRPFRLNIDRSFIIKGFGNVVTGTVLSSQVKPGDTLTLLPKKKSIKVRGIQVHQSDMQFAQTGQRAAINIAGVGKEDLSRGMVLVEENSLSLSKTFLAEITTISSLKYKIKKHSKIHIHIGTQELLGKIFWFEDDPFLDEDKSYHVHIKINESGVTAPGDAVLIRSFSPVTTIAGGKVLYIDPPGIRQIESKWDEIFYDLSSDDFITKIKQVFNFIGYKSITIAAVRKILFENEYLISHIIDKLVKLKYLTEFVFKNEKHFVSSASMDRGIQIIESEMEMAHAKNKLISGYNFQQILNRLKPYGFSESFLERTMERAVKSGRITFNGTEYNTLAASEDDNASRIKQEIINLFKQSRFSVPDVNELADQLKLDSKTIKNLITSLTQNNELKSIGGKFYLYHEVLNELINFMRDYFTNNNEIDVTILRDYTGCSRKYLIPLFEYLDANKYTERRGDVRIAGPGL